MSATNRSAFVFPIPEVGAGFPLSKAGLTKREWFAGLAMQGMLAACNGPVNPDEGSYPQGRNDSMLSRRAVAFADALLAELAKEVHP